MLIIIKNTISSFDSQNGINDTFAINWYNYLVFFQVMVCLLFNQIGPKMSLSPIFENVIEG